MTSRPAAPRTPSEWFAAAEDVYREFLAALATYGVEPDPELRFVSGDGPNPYYEHATKTIGMGMPDPDVPAGRLYWIFAARALGLRSVDEVLAVAADELPLIVAHEVTHHLRHHYHAPSENNYVEEQVANEVALAFLNEHPVYRATIPRLREHSERASEHLRGASPNTSPYLPGFQPDLGEALVARGDLQHESLDAMRLLADCLGEPLDVLFDEADLVPDAGFEGARDHRREAETYFNSRYAADLLEYAFFHHEWLRLYLLRADLPTLGEALEAHILTDDWEIANREGTVLLLESTLGHPDDALASAAAEALAEEAGEEAVPALLGTLGAERPVLRAAVLRTLNRLTTGDDRVIEAARRLLGAATPAVRAAAAALLAEASGENARTGRKALAALLASREPGRRAALEEAAALGDVHFLPTLRRALGSTDASERELALRGLSLMLPEATVSYETVAALSDPADAVRIAAATLARKTVGGMTPEALAALARALDDPVAAVREEAAGALRALGNAAAPALREVRGSWRARVQATLLLHTLGDLEGEDRTRRVVGELSEAAAWLAGERAALSDTPGPEGLLIREALTEERRELAELALLLAGALRNPRAMDLALRGLVASGPNVREAALQVARSAVPPDLTPLIEPMLGKGEGSEMARGVRVGSRAPGPPSQLLRELAAEAQEVAEARTTGQRTNDGEAKVLTTIEKLMYLRAVPVFRAVVLADLRPLAEDFVALRYEEGERIFGFGDEGDALYVMTAGRVAVDQDLPEGGLVRVAELGSGDHFGETSFFTGEPRSAAATALEDTTVLSLDREAFLRLTTREPRILVEIVRVLSRRLREANVDLG